MRNEKASFAWADRLRNLATFMVVALHVSAPVAQEYTLYDTWFWWSGNLWNSATRPSVPLFVMLSGFLLLGKDYPVGDFVKKRLLRVAVPALFWMVVYCIYNYFAHNNPNTLKAAVIRIVEGPVHYHLWFIYLILGLYLTCPILRPWVKTATERDFRYFFALCILGTWVYKILSTFFHVHLGLYFELFTNQVGFFVLGHYLGQRTLPRWAPWACIAAGTAITALGTYWCSKGPIGGGRFHPFFYDYLTPNVTLAAIGWFALVRQYWNDRPLLRIERDFAAASFGLYFIHVLVMDWMGEAGYWQTKYHPFFCIPVLIALVCGLGFLFVGLLRALPGGERVT